MGELKFRQICVTWKMSGTEKEERELYGLTEDGRVYYYEFRGAHWIPLSMSEKDGR